MKVIVLCFICFFAFLIVAIAPSTRLTSRADMVIREKVPMTGVHIPSMASFDRIIPELMNKWTIPGGAVAVMKDGRLVFARGYGFADRESGQKVEPNALFRIASLSKSFTSVAILKLVEERKLRELGT